MPATPQTYSRHSYHTLAREKQFREPATNGADVPILNEFVTPHIESFNALFDDSGLPQGDGDGRGLLSLAIADIGARVVFDGKGEVGEPSGQGGWGNRLSCAVIVLFLSCVLIAVCSLDRVGIHWTAHGARKGQGRYRATRFPQRSTLVILFVFSLANAI